MHASWKISFNMSLVKCKRKFWGESKSRRKWVHEMLCFPLIVWRKKNNLTVREWWRWTNIFAENTMKWSHYCYRSTAVYTFEFLSLKNYGPVIPVNNHYVDYLSAKDFVCVCLFLCDNNIHRHLNFQIEKNAFHEWMVLLMEYFSFVSIVKLDHVSFSYIVYLH